MRFPGQTSSTQRIQQVQRGRLKLDFKQKCIQVSAYSVFHSNIANRVSIIGQSTVYNTVTKIRSSETICYTTIYYTFLRYQVTNFGLLGLDYKWVFLVQFLSHLKGEKGMEA